RGGVVGVDELEDEAAAGDAELEGGDGVLDVAAEGGAPLDVEADDEAAEVLAVDPLGVADPGGGHGGRVGDQGLDGGGGGADLDVVEVVGLGAELVVDNGDLRAFHFYLFIFLFIRVSRTWGFSQWRSGYLCEKTAERVSE
ncbi:hypothetical protein TorRG33x02_332030, partial [Trema orientale]